MKFKKLNDKLKFAYQINTYSFQYYIQLYFYYCQTSVSLSKTMKKRIIQNYKKPISKTEEFDSYNIMKGIQNNNEQNQQSQKSDQAIPSLVTKEQVFIDKQLTQYPLNIQQFNPNSLFICPPSFDSKLYKHHIQDVLESFNSINRFTDNLQQKVDNVLQMQERQFIKSYQLHMLKIQQQIHQMEKKKQKMEQKIEYYQNEGIMSTLIQKVKKMELLNAELLQRIQNQAKKLCSFKLQNKVLREQLKRTQNKLKQFTKSKIMQVLTPNKSMQQQLQVASLQPNSIFSNSITKQRSNVFTTEIDTQCQPIFEKVTADKRKILHSQINHNIVKPSETHNNSVNIRSFKTANRLQSLKQLSLHKQFKKNTLKKSESNIQQEKKRNQANNSKSVSFCKEVAKLKKKNQALVKEHSQIFEKKLQLQAFLMQCIDEIKRTVKMRKKIRFCTFEEFSKQDRITLLLKIVSNQEILKHLYQKIFKQKRVSCQRNNKQISAISF